MNPVDQLRDMLGEEIGVSDWVTVTQSQIDDFAEATGDHQWIHSDPARAAAGPFGATIAHGLLTLAIAEAGIVAMGLPKVPEPRMLINYGTDRVRFLTPVRVDSRVRTRARLACVQEIDGGARFSLATTVEIDGEEKPAMAAEIVSLAYW